MFGLTTEAIQVSIDSTALYNAINRLFYANYATRFDTGRMRGISNRIADELNCRHFDSPKELALSIQNYILIQIGVHEPTFLDRQFIEVIFQALREITSDDPFILKAQSYYNKKLAGKFEEKLTGSVIAEA